MHVRACGISNVLHLRSTILAPRVLHFSDFHFVSAREAVGENRVESNLSGLHFPYMWLPEHAS